MKTWMKIASVVLVIMMTLGVIGATTAQAQGNGGNGQGGRQPLMRVVLQSVLTATEKATKLDRAAIVSELRSGKKLSEVITGHGGSVDAVKAEVKADLEAKAKQAVADKKITQEQSDKLLANLDTVLTQVMDYTVPTKQDRRESVVKGLEYLALVRETSSETKVSLRDIMSQLRDGKTLADVAKSNNGDVAKIVEVAVSKVTDRVNQMEKNGRITSDEAKKLLDGLKDTLTNLMNNPAPMTQFGRMGRGFGDKRGGFGGLFGPDKNAPDAQATPEATPGL